MALLILALLQRIFLMSSLMLLLVWLIFFMVLIKLLPILGTISGKTVKLMVLALICLGNFFFSSRRRHTMLQGDWSSDVCSSDLRRRRRRVPWAACRRSAPARGCRPSRHRRGSGRH